MTKVKTVMEEKHQENTVCLPSTPSDGYKTTGWCDQRTLSWRSTVCTLCPSPRLPCEPRQCPSTAGSPEPGDSPLLQAKRALGLASGWSEEPKVPCLCLLRSEVSVPLSELRFLPRKNWKTITSRTWALTPRIQALAGMFQRKNYSSLKMIWVNLLKERYLTLHEFISVISWCARKEMFIFKSHFFPKDYPY